MRRREAVWLRSRIRRCSLLRVSTVREEPAAPPARVSGLRRERGGLRGLTCGAVQSDCRSPANSGGSVPRADVLGTVPVCGIVPWLVAECLLRALDGVVLPVVVTDPVDDLVAVVGLERSLVDVRAVPHREPHRLAALVVDGRVVLVEVADPDVADREVVGVVEVAADDLPRDLRDAVLVARPGEFGAVQPEVVAGAVHPGGALVGLEGADGVVRGGVHHLLDILLDGDLVDGVGAVDVVREDAAPGGAGPGVAREVDDGADPLGGGGDIGAVLDLAGPVGVVGLLGRGVVVEKVPVVGVAEPIKDRPPDVAARASEQNRLVHSGVPTSTADK